MGRGVGRPPSLTHVPSLDQTDRHRRDLCTLTHVHTHTCTHVHRDEARRASRKRSITIDDEDNEATAWTAEGVTEWGPSRWGVQPGSGDDGSGPCVTALPSGDATRRHRHSSGHRMHNHDGGSIPKRTKARKTLPAHDSRDLIELTVLDMPGDDEAVRDASFGRRLVSGGGDGAAFGSTAVDIIEDEVECMDWVGILGQFGIAVDSDSGQVIPELCCV